MKNIQVLGSGCSKCEKTAAIVQAVADEAGVAVQVVKDTSAEAILRYGVMKTPAVVVDGELVHSGSIPDQKSIARWLL